MGDVVLGVTLALTGSLASAVAVGFTLVLLPADAFDQRGEMRPPSTRHPVLRVFLKVIKNLIGALLIALGVILIFAPGSGLLTILLGLLLVDFPGKKHLERAIISRPRVFQTVNKLRHRYGKPPFTREGGEAGTPDAPR